MLSRLTVTGFKSLLDVTLAFPKLTVLFGPNASGKSNILDAVQLLSRVGTSRTLSDALTEPIRGYPIEAFSFRADGLAGLLNRSQASFALDARLVLPKEERIQYRVEVDLQPQSGALVVADELLAQLNKKGEIKTSPIEKVGNHLRVRRAGPARPREEELRQNHTVLSDPRLSGNQYKILERCRGELTEWRTYYLDPRVAMRSARPPAEVADIGVLGEDIAPFLYRLNAERHKAFDALKRTFKSLIPTVEDVSVDLDTRRGTLDILVRQAGVDFSSRIISEGTLRVLALCAITVNPWGGRLLAFEEPENGVHPRRLELIVKLLVSLALDRARQVIITTHSPLLCDAVYREGRLHPQDIALLNVRRRDRGTIVEPFDFERPLFHDQEIATALSAGSEDGLFESLMLRGMLGE